MEPDDPTEPYDLDALITNAEREARSALSACLHFEDEAKDDLDQKVLRALRSKCRSATEVLFALIQERLGQMESGEERAEYLRDALRRSRVAGFDQHERTRALVTRLQALIEEEESRPRSAAKRYVPEHASIPWHGSAADLGKALELIHNRFVGKGVGEAGLTEVPLDAFLDRVVPLFASAKTGEPIDPETARTGSYRPSKARTRFAEDFRERFKD